MSKPLMRTELSMLLGKIELNLGEDALPTAANDAFLVGDLDIQLETTEIERNVIRTSFSPVPTSIGRKVVNVTFTHEIKSSGDVGISRPKLGSLLRACAMKERLITAGAANQIENPITFGTVKGPVPTWSKDVAPTDKYGSYLVEVVTAGASGAAQVQVTRWGQGTEDDTVLPNTRLDARVNDSATTTLTLGGTRAAPTFTVGGVVAEGDQIYAVIGGVVFYYEVTAADAIDANPDEAVATALTALIAADTRLTATVLGAVITVGFESGASLVTLTSGTTAIVLGDSDAEITPTWAGNLVLGQKWIVQLYEVGYMYTPTSKSSETDTMTLYVFKDGVLHKVTGCIGTVTFTGEAGQVGQASFEFQGNYDDPVEEPAPIDSVFEETVPPQIELAEMSIAGDNDFCAQSFTYTLGNQINLNECINAKDGFLGAAVTAREPTAQLNPSATYEAYTGMWGNFSRATQFPIHTRVGSEAGNIVRFYADRSNFTGLTYGDRNGTVSLEATFSLNGVAPTGDDELRVVFC